MSERGWIIAPKRADGKPPGLAKAVGGRDHSFVFLARGDATKELKDYYDTGDYAVFPVLIEVMIP